MNYYEHEVLEELKSWQMAMQESPSFFEETASAAQETINGMIPESIHKVLTTAIKQMTRAVIFGAEFSTNNDHTEKSLEEIERTVRQRIDFYTTTAAAEGAFTGYGGLLLAMTDLPLWLSLKIKMLYDIADLYRYDISDYKERVYMLHIFQITFSRQEQRNTIYRAMENWETEKKKLPDDINQFDWKRFQLDYRNYLDLAKMFQMIPGVGAIVGFYVNRKLTRKLGENAMNAYRLRRLQIKL